MSIARIENGVVVEVRGIDIEDVPAHKRGAWRTVIDQPPMFDARLENIEHTEWEIQGEQVRKIYAVNRLPRPTQLLVVKAECQRRIIIATGATDLMNCLVKQMNAQMRGAELINIKASGGVLTSEQEIEAAALQALADKIKALRARSNEIEALDPTPSDFDADARWL